MSIRIALLTMLGGGLGAFSRSLINQILPFSPKTFSLGTFSINMLGCLLIGYFFSKLESETQKYFWITGILGGFTTFSGFGMELMRYLQERSFMLFAVYSLLSVSIGLFMVWVGQKLASY